MCNGISIQLTFSHAKDIPLHFCICMLLLLPNITILLYSFAFYKKLKLIKIVNIFGSYLCTLFIISLFCSKFKSEIMAMQKLSVKKYLACL